jgi:hypothetical protein
MAAARASSARLVHADISVGDRLPEEVNTMAAWIPIEQESGVTVGRVHSHNGYYAGDFSSVRHAPPASGPHPEPSPSVIGERALNPS